MVRKNNEKYSIQQVSQVDHLSRFPLHYLNYVPEVPVTIKCEPEVANEHALPSYECLNKQHSSKEP